MLLVKPFYGLLESDPTGGGFSSVPVPSENFGKFYVYGNTIYGANHNFAYNGSRRIQQSTNKGATWSNAVNPSIAIGAYVTYNQFDFSVSEGTFGSTRRFSYSTNDSNYGFHVTDDTTWRTSAFTDNYPLRTEADVGVIISCTYDFSNNPQKIRVSNTDAAWSSNFFNMVGSILYKMKANATAWGIACTNAGLIMTNGAIIYQRTTSNGLGSNTVYGGHMASATTVLAATSNGLYRSVNSGVNFTNIYATRSFADVVEAPLGASSCIYALVMGMVTPNGGLFVSKNQGASWKQYTTGLPINIDSGARIMVSSYNGVNYIYVTTSDGALYRSHVSLP